MLVPSTTFTKIVAASTSAVTGIAANGTATILAWNPDGDIVAGNNGYGDQANQLCYPAGYYIDKNGFVYVADSGNNRIQKWAPDSVAGETVAGGQGAGNNASQLNYPASVHVDDDGNMYILDSNNYRVQYWPKNSAYANTTAGGRGSGSGGNQISFAVSMTFDSYGNFYIAETLESSRSRVTKWVPNATSGTVVAGIEGQDSGSDQLNNPSGAYEDNNGTVYVADTYNHRVQKWLKNARNGTAVIIRL
ncbi:unnamed protein product [Didymodactylos carnosus]|uniref:NHL repeat containing protein n=1 Tax=Didymodactylos carnosus TaxID=1234261 RepID=A0A815S7H9_9BILA|nr:unnamed protein product [Didymodactylos carnosus]CAF4350429.1 unnamed protein product [Didymodactylos carnosus]